MSEQTNNNELLTGLNALLSQVQNQGAGAGQLSGWQQSQGSPVNVQGVAVPVSVQSPIGKVRVYFWLGPEAAATPAALMQALEQMSAAGIRIDAWEGKSSGWGGNNDSSRSGYGRGNRRW